MFYSSQMKYQSKIFTFASVLAISVVESCDVVAVLSHDAVSHASPLDTPYLVPEALRPAQVLAILPNLQTTGAGSIAGRLALPTGVLEIFVREILQS